MKTRAVSIKFLIVLLLTVLVFQAVVMASRAYDKSNLTTTDHAKAAVITQSVQKYKLTEVLGPMAPVALSPFFGMACLSGTSIASSHGLFGMEENNFLSGSDVLNNPLVFIAFLGLTVLTSVPKLTTVSKAFAEVGDQVESYAGLISYLVIFSLAGTAATEAIAGSSPVIYQAGIISFTQETLLMAAMIANFIVIYTVKFFFELLCFITPVPFLDAIFEACNKAVVLALSIVYAYNPYYSLLINLVLFAICLSIFNWARRRAKYLKTILLEPVLYKMGIFKIARRDKRTKCWLSEAVDDIKLIVKVFPGKKFKKIKKKQLCYLVASGDKLLLVKKMLFKAPRIEEIDAAGLSVQVIQGVLSNSIEFTSQGKPQVILLFSKTYNDMIDEIKNKLSAKSDIST